MECIAIVDDGVLAALLSMCDRAQSARTKRNRSRLENLMFPEEPNVSRSAAESTHSTCLHGNNRGTVSVVGGVASRRKFWWGRNSEKDKEMRRLAKSLGAHSCMNWTNVFKGVAEFHVRTEYRCDCWEKE